MQDDEMKDILEAIARDTDAAPSNRVAAIRELRALRRGGPTGSQEDDFEGSLTGGAGVEGETPDMRTK